MRGGARERIPQGYREQGEQGEQVGKGARSEEREGERGRGRGRQSGGRPWARGAEPRVSEQVGQVGQVGLMGQVGQVDKERVKRDKGKFLFNNIYRASEG